MVYYRMLLFSNQGSARNGIKKVLSKIPNIPQNIAGISVGKLAILE